MTTIPALRASSMPLAMRCPGSVHPEPGEVLIDPHNEAADLGSAVHEIMATIVRDGLDHLPEIVPVAQRWGVDPDELAGLSGAGLKCWRTVSGWFGNTGVPLECEVEMRAGPLTGHADVMGWHDDESVLIVDFKTGRLDSDHYDQMAAYALLAWAHYERQGAEPLRFLVAVIWVRDGEVEVYEFSREEVDAWYDRAFDTIKDWDGVYHPGSHCNHCPRFASCPARRQVMRQQIADLAEDMDESSMEAMVEALVGDAAANPETADRLAQLTEYAKAIESLAADFRKTVRDQVAARGGTLEGNEKTLHVETQRRRYLKTRKAWDVLSRRVAPNELIGICSIPRTKALDLIVADVPKGQNKATREEVEAELDEAGAVEIKEIPRLNAKRNPKAIAERSEA